jgi:hypothetical protein
MTELVTEIPRCCSIAIQSDLALRRSPRARTSPASRIAPAEWRSFSVSVVLPASGWEMIAKVRRCRMEKFSSPVAVIAPGAVRSSFAVMRVPSPFTVTTTPFPERPAKPARTGFQPAPALDELVPDAGFEPATFGLQNRCSTN